MPTKNSNSYKLRRLRQIVQIIFFIAFTFLLVKASFGRVIGSWIPVAILSSTIVILTLILGRVWCGWMCPMGTVLYWTQFKKTKKRKINQSNRWLMIKYILLLLIIIIVLIGLLSTALDWLDINLLACVIIIVSVLILSILLNLITDLFWCRYLCPLGGAMALLSKIASMRRIVRSDCKECLLCAKACPMGTIDAKRDYKSDKGECIVCMDCMTACKSDSNRFQFSNPFRR